MRPRHPRARRAAGARPPGRRFADNPAVLGEQRARFYAGAPIALDDGSRVATLCVVDHRPRLLDDAQLAELRRLAAGMAAELQRDATT